MLLPGHSPAGNAARYGTHKAMMTGKVPGNAADESPPEATSGIGRHRRRRYGKSQRATKQQRFHVHRSAICCRNARRRVPFGDGAGGYKTRDGESLRYTAYFDALCRVGLVRPIARNCCRLDLMFQIESDRHFNSLGLQLPSKAQTPSR
jgi:hypothetical protein